MTLRKTIEAQMFLVAFCLVSLSSASAACLSGLPGGSPNGSLRVPGVPMAILAADKNSVNDDGRSNDRDDQEAPIVGLWDVTITQGEKVFLRGFDIFHSDHTEVLNEFDDPRTGNVCLGVWKHAGQHTFKLKHPAFLWDANGNWIGYRILRETITVDASGNNFSGIWGVDITDTSGNLLSHIDAVIVRKTYCGRFLNPQYSLKLRLTGTIR